MTAAFTVLARMGGDPMLIDDKKAFETPAPASNTPEPQRLLTNATISNPNAAIPGLREGGAAGAGALFSTGDVPVQAGPGTPAEARRSGGPAVDSRRRERRTRQPLPV